ncbi:hypothetical protein EVAR_80266_1 [Eumeta japonica]|uniref:Uncharacterized protein n=1 Tax=Eumeta variegata TaxID=151549 RepID=A0A4C1UBD8_EUMVA|nr:hypothetical protein EVAR_80266_1 [Eumeta japonica]
MSQPHTTKCRHRLTMTPRNFPSRSALNRTPRYERLQPFVHGLDRSTERTPKELRLQRVSTGSRRTRNDLVRVARRSAQCGFGPRGIHTNIRI